MSQAELRNFPSGRPLPRAIHATCGNILKQRSVKGNFIISGVDIPRYYHEEHLFDVVYKLIWEKHNIELNWHHMKALHRLPGNSIIMVMNTRMPGSAFQALITAVNSNPNPRIKIYLNLQLMEPFDMMHYAARKLKAQGVISYYKLDENGDSWISISQDKYSFKFTMKSTCWNPMGTFFPGFVFAFETYFRTRCSFPRRTRRDQWGWGHPGAAQGCRGPGTGERRRRPGPPSAGARPCASRSERVPGRSCALCERIISILQGRLFGDEYQGS